MGVGKIKHKDRNKGKNKENSSGSSAKTIFYNVNYQDENIRKTNFHLILCATLLIVLVLFTYAGAFRNEFVDWDDFNYVVNNDLVRNPGDSFIRELFTTPVASNYHPLTILSMRLNSNVCASCPNGISPAPFIMWNVIIHIFNTVLVLILVFLLSKRNILIALFSALFFGVHPMHVESVAWISERKDVLYTFFFLAGLISYIKFIKGDKRKVVWYLVTLIFFIASCLSKATAVIFPLVLVLISFAVSRPEEENHAKALRDAASLRNLSRLIPFFIISVFVGLMAYKIQSGENFLGLLDLSNSAPDVVNKIGPFSVFQRFEIGCYGLIVYIFKFFIPVNLLAIHPYPPMQDFSKGPFAVLLVFSVVIAAIIFILAARSLRKSRVYLFSTAFYFITIVLVLQIITVGISITSDRYSYLPYAGLSMIPASFIANSPKAKRTLVLIFSACFVIMLITISIQQVKVWNNTETLWTKVINRYPNEELPRRSRGKYYSRKAVIAKSEAEKKMFEERVLADFNQAIKAGTKSADVYMGTGIIYGSKGDLKKAELLLNEAIAIDPQKGSAYYNRALINDQLNKKEEAIKDYNMALIYKPDLKRQIINNRSNLYLETGRYREAITDFDFLISLDANNFYYFSNRGIAKQQISDFPGAISDFKRALQLQPDDTISMGFLKKLQAGKK